MKDEPYIPETITVHLGTPKSDAPNVTVPFPDYIKNVASSEIYPTWPENAIRANVYAIVSYTLNRIYTEWYRSQGYNFDITNSTQYDQYYVPNRDIFEPVSVIVDELFNDYVRKRGSVEPYFTAFCNGTTAKCDGLSQWGTVELAKQGKTPYEILKHYYGDDIDLVFNAPVRINTPSYPGTPFGLGSASNEVRLLQTQLNRISKDYPSIGKIHPVDGIYGPSTEEAVKKFQKIFNLPITGVVDKATWYRIGYIYTSVKRLSELNSEGIAIEDVAKQFSEELKLGMKSVEVEVLQYYLSVIGAYYMDILPVDVTGYFGDMTLASVKSFQQTFGLPETGVVDRATWENIYSAYQGIVDNVPVVGGERIVLYPGAILREGVTSEYVKVLQQYLTFISGSYNNIPAVSDTGYFGPVTKSAVTAFQKEFGLPVTGAVGVLTWDKIASIYSDLKYGYIRRPGDFPGYTITGAKSE